MILKWTETAFQENPDITLKHFANALNYVSEHHGEFYDHVIAKALVADMGENLHVHDIYGILAGLKDNPQAQELAKELAKYYNDRHALSQKVPEKKVDAQQKALTDENCNLEKQTDRICDSLKLQPDPAQFARGCHADASG